MTELSEEEADKIRDEFYVVRAEALNSYALLERALTFLFMTSLRAEPRYASLIVSKLINTRARNEVIQRITDWHTDKRFRPFTNSLFTAIATVDGLRNQLVHWHVNERTPSDLALIPSDYLSESEARMDANDIQEMGVKTLFLATVTGKFAVTLDRPHENQSWLERFERPLVYPPERDDPLFRFHTDSGDQLGPFYP